MLKGGRRSRFCAVARDVACAAFGSERAWRLARGRRRGVAAKSHLFESAGLLFRSRERQQKVRFVFAGSSVLPRAAAAAKRVGKIKVRDVGRKGVQRGPLRRRGRSAEGACVQREVKGASPPAVGGRQVA